jgi:hypothetical protein
VVVQHRSTQRHGGKVIELEKAKLRKRLQEIAAEHIRWGRRMAYRLLRREDWMVNHKRVERLCLERGLQLWEGTQARDLPKSCNACPTWHGSKWHPPRIRNSH